MCPSDAAFAISLGPTNPSPIVVAKETWIFRRAGFSPALWLLVPTFLLRNAPAWVTPLPSVRYEHSPTARNGVRSYFKLLKSKAIYYANIYVENSS